MDLRIKKYQNTLEYMFGVLSQSDDSRLYKSWRVIDYISKLNGINIFTLKDLTDKIEQIPTLNIDEGVIKDITNFVYH